MESIDGLLKNSTPTKRSLFCRLSTKEDVSDNLANPFSGKFVDDFNIPEKIYERMSEWNKKDANKSQ